MRLVDKHASVVLGVVSWLDGVEAARWVADLLSPVEVLELDRER